MGFNIKNNWGPNIEVNEGGKVTLMQDGQGRWYTADAEEAEVVEDVDAQQKVNVEVENGEQQKEEDSLNLFAPKKNLQELLKGAWFADARTDEKYDATWTDSLIEALMTSEYGEGIARQWAEDGERNKRDQLKGYVVGLLKDAGILKGSYDSIARKIGLTQEARTLSRYMGQGKKQPYADWVKEYVAAL